MTRKMHVSAICAFTILNFNCQSWNNFWTLPTLAYPAKSYAFQQNIPLANVIATISGNPTSCAAMPTLPTGVSLDALCNISGTPTGLPQVASNYTITANNSAGSASATLSIRISSTTAQIVYGQLGSFTTNGINQGGLSAASLQVPYTPWVDANGVYIADNLNQRVLFYAGTSTTATRVYGQGGSFTSNTANLGGLSASSLNGLQGAATDSGGVYILDSQNNRILYYSGTSTTASRVYGQGGSFTSSTANLGGVSADGLNSPAHIAFDSGGMYVADRVNNRVLYFAGTSTTASRVYGQGGSFTSNLANFGGLSANSLSSPRAVATDGTGLYISDQINNRVLYFSGTSTTASRVYGQGGSFTASTPNNGGISANSLSQQSGLATNSAGLYIADFTNNRILFYAGTSTTATKVFGQAGSFSTGTLNLGGVSADSLSGPQGIFLDNTGLFVAEANNNRVLVY